MNFLRCKLKSNLVSKNVVSAHLFSTTIIYKNNFTEAIQSKSSYQSVADFYAGKSVFLTGATGFVGRVLIERLLYTCKDIDRVYVLIREKKDASTQQRLQELLHNPIFTNLKENRPEALSKIVPIAGDVSNVRLGMNKEDEQTLIDKISVIFHSAANVKFRTPLAKQMQVNYEGTKHVMELGKKMKNLDVFVHVSTAFSDEFTVVNEVTYPPPRSLEETYRIIANHSDKPDVVRKLLGKWGVGYIFSKMMTEAYVANNHGDTPTIIVRPSMVTSVYKKPVPGYTDSWVTGTVLLCDIANGMMRVVKGKSNVTVELIPVDYVCNFLIVAAARNAKTKKCKVYNISTGHSNSIEWGKLSKLYITEGKRVGYVDMPFPMAIFTKAEWAIPALTFVFQTLPALIADIWLRVTGRQPRYMKQQRQVISRSVFSVPVTYSSWDITTTRARELISTLDDKDIESFPCDPVTVDWDEYVPIYCKGVKDYMIGDNNNKHK